MEIISTDVLVIGGGCAGMQAVVSAQKQGASVLQVLKRNSAHTGSSSYLVTEASGYGMADGFRDATDSPQVHYQDIMLAARSMADPNLARLLVENAPSTKTWLESIGVSFEKHDGMYLVTQGCYGSKPRNYTLRGHGTKIIDALRNQERPDYVSQIKDCMITDLIIEDGICHGAIGIQGDRTKILIQAKAVVLCAGGAGGIFSTSMNPRDITGDGYAMGYRSGAELMNMEFMQFGCGVAWPGFSILNSWIWSLHPTLRNRYGENVFTGILPEGITENEVMDRKSTHFPFSSDNISKYIEIAIQKARMLKATGEHDGVMLDVSNIQRTMRKTNQLQLFEDMWNISNQWYLSRGIDVSAGPMEISCFAHAVNGGLVIDSSAKTTIEGLYAAGEVAAGPHGADRLGGNMLPTCIVFGNIAGKEAAMYAIEKANHATLAENAASISIMQKNQNAILLGGSKSKVGKRMEEIKKAMGTWMMVVRAEEHMAETEHFLYRCHEELVHHDTSGCHPFEPFELNNAITTALMMVRAARWRKESRGSHYREDFPMLDQQFAYPFRQSRSNNPLFKEDL